MTTAYHAAVETALAEIRHAAELGPLFVNAAVDRAHMSLLSDDITSLMAPPRPKRTRDSAKLAERDQLIRRALRVYGEPPETLAKRFGITLSRVYQIDDRPKRTLAGLADRDWEIRRDIASGVMPETLAARYGLTLTRVRQIAEAAPSAGQRAAPATILPDMAHTIRQRRSLGWSVTRISGETGLTVHSINQFLKGPN